MSIFETNRRNALNSHKKDWDSEKFVGSWSPHTTSTALKTIQNVLVVSQIIEDIHKGHSFLRLRVWPALLRSVSISPVLWICSLGVIENITIPSQYTVEDWKFSLAQRTSTVLSKVPRKFQGRNGVLANWYKSWGNVNAVFSKCDFSNSSVYVPLVVCVEKIAACTRRVEELILLWNEIQVALCWIVRAFRNWHRMVGLRLI